MSERRQRKAKRSGKGGLSRSDWAKHTLRSIEVQRASGLPAARRAYRALPEEAQWEAAREVVATRIQELCAAYPNVVDVSCGFPMTTTKRRRRIGKLPSVIFRVLGKWKGKRKTPREGQIPGELLTYATINGERTLLAIPTDVSEADEYARGRPEVRPGLEIANRTNPEIGETGNVACALQRSSFPDKTWLLSARHVLSLSTTLHPEPTWGSKVLLRDDRTQVGVTRKVVGPMEPEPAESFDAQLAEVENGTALARALQGIRFTEVAQGEAELRVPLHILTPTGTIRGQFKELLAVAPPLDYHAAGRLVFHQLVRYEQPGPKRTMVGDSGSPVATSARGGKFLGMHIYRDGNLAYFVPAWTLLTPRSYQGAANGELWTLLNPDELVAAPSGPAPSPTAAEILTPAERAALEHLHGFEDSVRWRLATDGLRIGSAAPETTPGAPVTIERIWTDFAGSVTGWGTTLGVPVELIMATIATESSGKADAVRIEPRYESDSRTPQRVSVGLMQTLISTAREAVGDRRIDRAWLLDPDHSIEAGTRYIAKQRGQTRFDPPKVACAYNAGSIRPNRAPGNRWKMRQFPRDTGKHADRFVRFFNDCYRFFAAEALNPQPSLRVS